MRLRPFTLIELLAAIAVMLAILAISTVALRTKSSPAMQLDNAYSSFGSFCSRIRASATEYGEDRLVCYDLEANSLVAVAPAPEYVSETDEDAEKADKLQRHLAPLTWQIPEEIEIIIDEVSIKEFSASGVVETKEEESRSEAAVNDEDEDEAQELPGEVIFRVLSDGGVSGKREFEFKSGMLKIKLRFSRLTGLLSKVVDDEKN